ncbi:MAG: aldolase/citrate lyase family protein, partial [Bacteroidota bacterium]
MTIKNRVLDQLKENKPSLGGWVMTASVTCAEIMAQAGFDWVCIDAEHSPVNDETVQNMFIAIERHGAEPFVRIPRNDEVVFKKYLDMGAKGIVVPMVNSAEEVERAIAYASYSPQGIRSFALPRANGYGAFATEYFNHANENLFMGIMIEHVDALKNLDEIFSNKRIDAVFIGPYDLSGSMNIPGQFDHG